ncbi:MAG TPA: aromatic ring-hydroxylating dioxygenase subunit alpha [Stellaceae bacterium]|nr:aromatic ring-hydroxylating dioxygenase subunit alpha [Stellaceae bacterium]
MDDVQTRFRGDAESLESWLPLHEKITAERFAAEREKIFRRSWLYIGKATELTQLGSYFVKDLPTLGVSLIVVRGEDGKIRGFHNICRHRGNKLIRGGAGCNPSIRCGFHGWGFSNQGECVVVTDEHQFPGLDKGKLGLIPVATETWYDFVFVNFAPQQTLAEWLEDMSDQYPGYFEGHEKIASYSVEIESNWNLGVNSFTEGYHTLFIHHNTVPDYQGGKGNQMRHRPYMQLMKHHTRYSAPGNPDHHETPAEALAWRHGHKMLPAATFKHDGFPAGLNPSRADKWLFDVIELFPNNVMLTGQYWHMMLTFWPLSANRTVMVQEAFAYKPQNMGERLSQEFFRSRGREVLREDLNTLEAQHAALSSGAMKDAYLSRQESALLHHYRVADGMLGAP